MKEHLFSAHEIRLPNEFSIDNACLTYRNVNLLELVKKHGTPLKFTVLPSITHKIKIMKDYFKLAFDVNNYKGKYRYYYCTKSSHFNHVLKTVLLSDVGIEISSACDTELISSLTKTGQIPPDTQIICNGYKTEDYLTGIFKLMCDKRCTVLPIVDSKGELEHYIEHSKRLTNISIGIRLNMSYISSYARESRFGLFPEDILYHYKTSIHGKDNLKLTTLHLFNDKGIENTDSYWTTLAEVVHFYCYLKKINPCLTTLDIGGGMPFKDNLNYNPNISELIFRIVSTIKDICTLEEVDEPDIITEFGKYTVAESTGTLFKILERKKGNERDWAIIDGSFITHLPDTWAIKQNYPVLPVNNLESDLIPYTLGGITCDSADFFPNNGDAESIMLPDTNEEQFLAFFHTGAYQEALSGFGGINHCLIPAPKHIIIDENEVKEITISTFSEKQSSQNMLAILGYQ